jgi:hypothetical protein
MADFIDKHTPDVDTGQIKPCWDPAAVSCRVCTTTLDSIAEQDGEYVLWCPCCGTLLTANEFVSIKDENWRLVLSCWKNSDPRIDINRHAAIIILRPCVGGYTAGTGQVETKHGWYIHTSFDDHRGIDDWDPTWLWTWAPRTRT